MNRWRILAVIAAIGAVLFVLGGVLAPRDLTQGFDLLVLIAMASAWNLVGGYGGLFSVGHSMFVGVGSYATAMIVIKQDFPLLVVLALSALVAGGLAGVVALPLFRLRAAYFSVASLGLALAVQAWMLNWNWTGASTGLNMPLSSYVPPDQQYRLAVVVASLTVAVTAFVVTGGLGLRLMALRDDEEAAAHIGIRRYPVALATWVISGGLTGLAGALVALQKSSLEPVSAFSIGFNLNMIVSSVLGGLGTLAGPPIGAIVSYGIGRAFKGSPDWATLINGVLILVAIRIAPGGIVGTARSLMARVSGVLRNRQPPNFADTSIANFEERNQHENRPVHS